MTAIAYTTDLEGQWRKLAELCEGSDLVSLDARGALTLAPGAVFVFGGDAVDRGPDSRRIVRALLDAKRRYGERVVLLAGNRDLNKLRIARELHGNPSPRAPSEIANGPRAALLKWIFTNSMNAPNAFELRREELGEGASDEDVATSFLADVMPGGDHAEYLRAVRLAFRCGETLFVHGAVTGESLGHVPGEPAATGDVDEWIARLNAWCASQIAAFYDAPTAAEPPWRGIIDYQGPVRGTRLNQASVVYGRYTDEDGNPWLPSRVAITKLRAAGVHRVVAGHTPSGDCPAVLREDDFEIVMADNSYSRIEAGTRVRVDGASLRIEGRAELDDGARERFQFDLDLGRDPSPVALRDPSSSRLVKGALAGGGYLTFRGLPKYQYEQRRASEEELRARPLRTARSTGDT